MKNHEIIKENAENKNQRSEYLKKKDTNLKSNSTLYFQIGLILCLLASYALFEMTFETQLSKVTAERPLEDDPWTINIFTVEPNTPQVNPIDKKVAMLTTKPPIVKPDDHMVSEPVEIITSEMALPEPITGVKIPKSNFTPQPVVPTTVNIMNVEKAPVFPGCESASNNAERLACMSDKLATLIQRQFDTDLAHELGLSGIQKIQVQFKIDDQGKVTDIKTRSPHVQLDKEAQRVIEKIPIMTPGMQRNTPVSVLYYLPIAFSVQ